jgi:hypothetical protein
MFKHQTLSQNEYDVDEVLSQQTGNLIEQKLVTLYRDESGRIYEHITIRHYTKNDYYDSNHNKYIG